MKPLFSLLLFALFFASCSKEKSLEIEDNAGGTPAGYYIQAKMDGTEKIFDVSPAASINNSAGSTIVSLIAMSSTGEVMNLNISLITGVLMANTTYVEGSSATDYMVLGTYATQANATTAFVAGLPLNPTADPLSITITSKTATEVAGTFKGAFYKVDLANGTPGLENKRFTEGSFKLLIR